MRIECGEAVIMNGGGMNIDKGEAPHLIVGRHQNGERGLAQNIFCSQ